MISDLDLVEGFWLMNILKIVTKLGDFLIVEFFLGKACLNKMLINKNKKFEVYVNLIKYISSKIIKCFT